LLITTEAPQSFEFHERNQVITTTEFNDMSQVTTVYIGSPVREIEGKIDIDEKGMAINHLYEVKHKGETFLVTKTATGSIRIYEVEG
jgi:hypothetical protein